MTIDDLRSVHQGLEAMCKSFWNYQRSSIAVAQNFCVPATKCRRAAPQIYRHVEDLTAKTRHQLEIRRGMILEMQTAHSSSCGCHGVCDLNNSTIVHYRSELISAVKTFEITSIVFDDGALDHAYTFQRSIAQQESSRQFPAASYSRMSARVIS